jgi:hypothetical protein
MVDHAEVIQMSKGDLEPIELAGALNFWSALTPRNDIFLLP